MSVMLSLYCRLILILLCTIVTLMIAFSWAKCSAFFLGYENQRAFVEAWFGKSGHFVAMAVTVVIAILGFTAVFQIFKILISPNYIEDLKTKLSKNR